MEPVCLYSIVGGAVVEKWLSRSVVGILQSRDSSLKISLLHFFLLVWYNLCNFFAYLAHRLLSDLMSPARSCCTGGDVGEV